MKQLLFLILLFQSAKLMCQPYLNETSRWKQYYRYSVYPPGIAFEEDMLIQLDGDTIVGNMTYHRVLKTGIATRYYVQKSDTIYQGPIHEYLDPIREADQRFYAFDRKSVSEYILYDFSAAVGDTLIAGYCQRDTVLSIDTIYLGNRPRRRYHLPYSNSELSTLVEGVGSTFGFPWQPCNVFPPFYSKLQCYSQDGDFIQFDPTFDCSGLVAADVNIKQDKFSILPNPFTDEIDIHFSSAYQGPVSIAILYLMGAIVFEKHLLSPEPITHITLPNLPAGIYVICISDSEGFTARKIMKR